MDEGEEGLLVGGLASEFIEGMCDMILIFGNFKMMWNDFDNIDRIPNFWIKMKKKCIFLYLI